MSIEHVSITDPNIHEPKGAASAASGRVYVASGSGTGSWSKYKAADLDTEANTAGKHLTSNGAGGITYEFKSQGRVYSSTTNSSTTATAGAFTKASNPTSGSGIAVNFTEGTNRLTYSGSSTKTFKVDACISAGTGESGYNVDVGIYKNGALIAGSIQQTALGSPTSNVASTATVSLASGDYVEIWVRGVNPYIPYLSLTASEI